MDLNKAAKRAYNNALARRKISEGVNHEESVATLKSEFDEFCKADEKLQSVHLNGFPEAVEELTDILIGSLTELYRRGVDVELVVHAKLKYNEFRLNQKRQFYENRS